MRRLISQPLPVRSNFALPAQASAAASPTTLDVPNTSMDQIDEIWFVDDVHHAASIDLNAGKLGALHSWEDGGRDFINLLENVMPPTVGRLGEDGVVLPWRPASPSKRIRRKIVGIGHSFGATAM